MPTGGDMMLAAIFVDFNLPIVNAGIRVSGARNLTHQIDAT